MKASVCKGICFKIVCVKKGVSVEACVCAKAFVRKGLCV